MSKENKKSSVNVEDKKSNKFTTAMKVLGRALAKPFVLMYRGIKWLLNKIKSLFKSKNNDKVSENETNENESIDFSTIEKNNEDAEAYSEEFQEQLDKLAATAFKAQQESEDADDETDEDDSKEEINDEDDPADEIDDDEDDDDDEEPDFIDFKTTQEKTARLTLVDPFDELKPILLSTKDVDEFAEKVKAIGFEIDEIASKDNDGKLTDVFFKYPKKPSSELRAFYDTDGDGDPIIVLFYCATYKEVKADDLGSLAARLNFPMDKNLGEEDGAFEGFKTTTYHSVDNRIVSLGVSEKASDRAYIVCVHTQI